MPALPPNTSAKVLVTGATGYVGQWVLRVLLDRGHTARVVVRSDSKAQEVKDGFLNDASKLEYVVVEDMSKVRLNRNPIREFMNDSLICAFRTVLSTKLLSAWTRLSMSLPHSRLRVQVCFYKAMREYRNLTEVMSCRDCPYCRGSYCRRRQERF